MNEKFFALPQDKQRRIIQAGFHVFAREPYRKCPVHEIAARAGISKSLLFHYFRNKKELYLFLWNQAAEVTLQAMTQCGCYEPADLFTMMERGMRVKLRLMRKNPDMTAFAIRAFYEKEPEISAAIQADYRRWFGWKAQDALLRVDPAEFRPGLDLATMYRQMYLMSEGYLWEALQRGETIDADTLERDFSGMLAFWRQVYLREAQEQTPQDAAKGGDA